MFLEKIEIRGFKSFANKTEFIFPRPEKNNKGITAIVGPNGSGKSNVVDAIRWVLGEQSLKTLRGKKSSDIIFHGSRQKARLGMAEVNLFINNEDRALDIDYPQLMLTRRLYRNGEGEYLINKNKARLGDIIMLLARANFGQKSFSIVGQGMIDYILRSGIKERKEFFDEAVGVKQYQIKRRQTTNTLERTKSNLKQIKITLSELEPRLKSLSRQAKKLEKRQEIKKQLTYLQTVYYSRLYFNLQKQINQIRPEIKSKKQTEKKLSEELLTLQKKLAPLAQENHREIRFNQLKEKFDFYQQQKNRFLQELTVLKGEMEIKLKTEGQLDLAWIMRTQDELKSKKNELENVILKENREKKIIEEQINKLRKTKEQINQEMEKLKKQINIDDNNLFNTPFYDKWKNFLTNIINKQKKLIEKIKKAHAPEDFAFIEKYALEIKNDLKKLFQEKISNHNQEQSRQNREKINEIKNRQETLIKKKNELWETINSLKTKKDIINERQKITQSRLREIYEEISRLKKEIEKAKTLGQNLSFKKTQQQAQKIEKKIQETETKIKEIKNQIDNFNRQEQEKKELAFKLQDEIQQQQIKLNQNKNEINRLMIELTRLETQEEGLINEIKKELKKIDLLDKNLAQKEADTEKIKRLKNQLELIGGIDPETIKEYQETKKRYQFLKDQTQDMEQTVVKLEKIVTDLDKMIKNKFNESFSKINKEFNKYFKILFEGGEAKLIKNIIKPTETLTTEENQNLQSPVNNLHKKQEIGIEIQAAPKGKKLKDINILSGGERALTSIALICAIISINPSPFVVLDEVDAALDEANSVRFAKILKNLSHKTQFITITHNRATMEVAKTLYGITVQEEGVSKVLSLSLEDARQNAAR